MKLKRSHKIHKHVANITMLASRFHAEFGRDYLLNNSSSKQAWALYRDFMNEQAHIANLLDMEAVQKPYTRWEKWWEKQDVMSLVLIHELAKEVLRLIESLSYLKSKGEDTKNNPRILAIQESIAGLLHPDVCQNALHYEEAG